MAAGSTLIPTLFFIPDISGFTAFVNTVEVNHSTHIISELLEILMSANLLRLKVSEIEGDAIFFYRTGKEPTFEDIILQVEEMFIAFHKHLAYYKRDRICQCGACSTANELSLKFVCHYGFSTKRKIGDFEKLFGPDVTLSHKLLKNAVPLNDYVLMTSKPIFSTRGEPFDWITLKKASSYYSEIGEVPYYYISLVPLKAKAVNINVRSQFQQFGKPVSVSKKIPLSLKKLHGIVTDFSLRPKWIFGNRFIKEDKDKLNTIGSKHLCVMPTTTMEFVVTAQHIKEGSIEYVEQSNSIRWLAPLNVVFILNKISDGLSSITIHIHYRKNWLTKLSLDFPLRIMMAMVARFSLLKLARYSTTASN